MSDRFVTNKFIFVSYFVFSVCLLINIMYVLILAILICYGSRFTIVVLILSIDMHACSSRVPYYRTINLVLGVKCD